MTAILSEPLVALEQNEEIMTEKNDWHTVPAPKDGSQINVQFRSGFNARAKWDPKSARWEVLRQSGEWVGMEYEHHSDPLVWWP
jgi:hypothetical protein